MTLRFIAAQAGTSSDSSDPFESISNFFDSGLWSAISILLRVFVVLLWLALIYWTYQDARRRIEAPGPIAACVALSVLIPFLGTVIYLIVRPPEYLDEARERELELLALEQRLGELGDAEGQQIVGRRRSQEAAQGPGKAGAPAGKGSFADALQSSIGEVNAMQQKADAAITALASGEKVSLHETMIAMEQADVSFRMMMQVRNKIVEAYQEILRMQV